MLCMRAFQLLTFSFIMYLYLLYLLYIPNTVQAHDVKTIIYWQA